MPIQQTSGMVLKFEFYCGHCRQRVKTRLNSEALLSGRKQSATCPSCSFKGEFWLTGTTLNPDGSPAELEEA